MIRPENPTKPDYEFINWYLDQAHTQIFDFNTEIISNITLYAKWQVQVVTPTKPFDKDALNELFGFDIYALLPSISSNEVSIYDDSIEGILDIYIDIFDWNEDAATQYSNALDEKLTYDEKTEYWILNETYFVSVYLDDQTYEQAVYGINIFNKSLLPAEKSEIDGDQINDIFGFDIYALLPQIVSNTYTIENLSDDDKYLVYINLPDWSDQDFNTYADALDKLGYTYDENEYTWTIENIWVVYFEEDDLGNLSFGIEGKKEIITKPTIDDVINSISLPSSTTQNLVLPTTSTVENALLSWASSNESVIGTSGIVVRGISDIEVVLTLTVTLNNEIKTKIFEVIVLKEGSVEPIIHTLSFDSNGGSFVSPIEVKDNEVAPKLTIPTKNGYTFVGWYIDLELEHLFDSQKPVKQDDTLYAKWQQEAVTENKATLLYGNAKYQDGVAVSTSHKTFMGTTNITAQTVTAQNVYWESGDNALRLGSSKNLGTLEFVFQSEVKINKIVVKASQYDSGVSLKIGDKTYSMTSEATDYTYSFDTPVTSFKLEGIGKRVQIISITIYYGSK